LTLKTIVRGNVTGKVLKSNQPINFLGSVDKKTGAITDQKHDLTVASGCALANIPLFILSPDEYDSMKDGDEISLG